MIENTKKEIYSYVKSISNRITIDNITLFSTANIANELKLSRNLVSQYLNQLHKEYKLIKINTRPVYFLDFETLTMKYQLVDLKWEYLSIEEIFNVLNNAKEKYADFNKAIGKDNSLSYCIEQSITAVTYPSNGLPILIFGESGSGKTFISSLISEYALNNKIIQKGEDIIYVNCMRYQNNSINFIKLINKIIEQEKKRKLIITFDDIHLLENEAIEKILAILEGKSSAFHTTGISHQYILTCSTRLDENIRQKLTARLPIILNLPSLDERLLTEEQLLALCQIDQVKEESKYQIYSMREWLTLIYEGKKEPSKTEFDLDYSETIRMAKKRGEIKEEDELRLKTNTEEKLKFEIKNMFTYNNRIVNGQLSTFVPILYKDMFLNSVDRAYLTKHKVEEALDRIIAIDYSAFCREVLYYDKEKRIDREYIIKEVFPDIILFPTVGTNGSMWQEITGKKRDSEGRFMFPSFFESNFDDVMIRMVGRFRWELCRSIQGTSWNNIKEKSLTSEYMDYIQFYRKNNELSEERKEKLKLQIQRNRNNSREIFASDYEAWIKGEAMGALRLNKYVRDILATYCPFSKQIRDKIRMQPLFEDAMARYNRNKAKKVHELELRYHALQKDQIELTKELVDTMKFYKEL